MLGETDKALDDYKTILDNDRADIRAVIEMASCYMAEGDIHNAMDRCMLALDMLDDIECPRQLQCRLHTCLADIFEETGDSEEAARHRAIAKRLKR